MFSISRFFVVAVVATAALFSTTLFAAAGKPVPGQIIVQRHTHAGVPDFEDAIDFYSPEGEEAIQGIDARVVRIPKGLEQAIVQELGEDPAVGAVERDRMLAPVGTIPDDPKYPSAWHLPLMGMPAAWDLSTGSGIVVAVLDTGVYAGHPDLAGKLLPGWNAVDQSNDWADLKGHGTNVAGVIAAVTNNGIGVASIARDAKILPVRVSNRSDGVAYLSDIARAITWAADNGARVANVSYMVAGSTTIENAARYMRDKGGLVVSAAGNDGTDYGYSDSAAVITVSATTSSDVKASWSNYGNVVDVAAPGKGIWTTNKSGGYSAVSGTSFASPATAAVAALIFAADPTLTPDEVETVLETTAADLGDPGYDTWYGHGRVDAAAALASVTNGQQPDTQAPSVAFQAPAAGASLSGTVQVAVSASDDQGVTAVKLFANGSLVATDTAAPYEMTLSLGSFAEGDSIQLTVRAYDAAGNTAAANRTIFRADTTPPVVTPPADVTVTATGELTSVELGSASAVDAVDGTLTATPDNSGPFTVGTHTVTWSATDSAGNTGTATQQVTVSLADVTPPVVTAPADRVVEASGALTPVALGSATALDNRDGVLAATPNTTGPFSVGTHTIVWSATDSAGNRGTAVQKVVVQDTTPPVLQAPADLTLDARGYLTAVELPTVTATDAVSGKLTAVPDDIGPFTSGIHQITWTATDGAGNSATVVSRLVIRPLADFALDQTVSEGARATVEVRLSGPAPAYPVEIPFTLSGEATNPEDHDAVGGSILIESGTRGSYSFAVVDDGPNGEGPEDLVFVMGTPDNAARGAADRHRVRIVERNMPPRVTLRATQGGKPVVTVYGDGGEVRVEAQVTDPNPGDSHSFDWSLSDAATPAAVAVASDTYSFDPAQLAPGVHELRVSVSDDGSPPETTEAVLVLRVVSQTPALDSGADSDGDGTDDLSEGAMDNDQDGIPDYLDAIDETNVLQAEDGMTQGGLLYAESGLALRLGRTALAAGRRGARIALEELQRFGGAGGAPATVEDEGRAYRFGLFDFEVAGLGEAGQSVQVVLPLSRPLEADAVYRKFVDGRWQDFVEDENNALASAPAEEGVCPNPGDASYQAGLNPGDDCVRLTIEDGGPNDADGLVNGHIVDPGGPAVAIASTDSDAGGETAASPAGGGGCTLGTGARPDPLWFLFAAIGAWRMRRFNRGTH